MNDKPSIKPINKPAITPAARIALLVLAALCFGLAVLDFIVHRKAYSTLEGFPLFYAIYGFIAFILVVAGGTLLRKLVMRRKNYYDPESKTEREDIQ